MAESEESSGLSLNVNGISGSGRQMTQTVALSQEVLQPSTWPA